jgi:hypothetical protein
LCPSAMMWPVLYILLQTHEGPIKRKPLFRYPPLQVHWDSGWADHPDFHTPNETEMAAYYLTLLRGKTPCPHKFHSWTIPSKCGSPSTQGIYRVFQKRALRMLRKCLHLKAVYPPFNILRMQMFHTMCHKPETLRIAWQEFDYRWDVCRITSESHIEP